jgi:hypothetical protein
MCLCPQVQRTEIQKAFDQALIALRGDENEVDKWKRLTRNQLYYNPLDPASSKFKQDMKDATQLLYDA